MPNSLEGRLKGKESEVLRSVAEAGINATMRNFGIKSRICFGIWLTNHKNGLSDASPLKGLEGGQKHMWLKSHRDFILNCLEVFGRDWALNTFCMGVDTLDRLINDSDVPFQRKITRVQRLEIQMRDTTEQLKTLANKVDKLEIQLEMRANDMREVRHRVDEQTALFQQFVEQTSSQLAKGLIVPLLRQAISFEGNLSETDGLNINSLLNEARRSMIEGVKP